MPVAPVTERWAPPFKLVGLYLFFQICSQDVRGVRVRDISSTNTKEGGDSSEEEGKEEDMLNENENTRNVGEMLVTVSEVTKPNPTKSAVWFELFVGWNEMNSFQMQ